MVEKAKPTVESRRADRFLPNPKLKLMEQCREVMRYKQLALRTEESYLQWIKRFLIFHRNLNRVSPRMDSEFRDGTSSGLRPPSPQSGEGRWRHPRDMGAAEVRVFLTHLAAERRVSASTQNQAFHPVR